MSSICCHSNSRCFWQDGGTQISQGQSPVLSQPLRMGTARGALGPKRDPHKNQLWSSKASQARQGSGYLCARKALQVILTLGHKNSATSQVHQGALHPSAWLAAAAWGQSRGANPSVCSLARQLRVFPDLLFGVWTLAGWGSHLRTFLQRALSKEGESGLLGAWSYSEEGAGGGEGRTKQMCGEAEAP